MIFAQLEIDSTLFDRTAFIKGLVRCGRSVRVLLLTLLVIVVAGQLVEASHDHTDHDAETCSICQHWSSGDGVPMDVASSSAQMVVAHVVYQTLPATPYLTGYSPQQMRAPPALSVS